MLYVIKDYSCKVEGELFIMVPENEIETPLVFVKREGNC